MATVTGKTSSKIDDLLDGMIVSGAINGSGQLILTTRDGSTINAGSLATPLGEPWLSTTTYNTGDVVGYAGALYRATSSSTNNPPLLYASKWQALTAQSNTTWVDVDPFFDADQLSAGWDSSYHTGSGTPTVVLTTAAGEHESGPQAVRLSLSAGQTQGLAQVPENGVRGGEIIRVQVRAKVTSLSTDSTLRAVLLQNNSGLPKLGVVGPTEAAETPPSLTTSFVTYTFNITAAIGAPRASIALIAAAPTNAAVFVVDWVRVQRFVTPPLTALDSYPVGAIYTSVDPTSPATLFGGTWSAFAAGRVLVGYKSSDPDFDTAEETGGSKTHTHDIDSADSRALIRFGLDGQFLMKETTDAAWQATRKFDFNISSSPVAGTPDTTTITTTLATKLRGSTVADSSVQPYVVVYMWKRTA